MSALTSLMCMEFILFVYFLFFSTFYVIIVSNFLKLVYDLLLPLSFSLYWRLICFFIDLSLFCVEFHLFFIFLFYN